MRWPLSQDYNEAMQLPATSFSDPELKAGHAATNALGLPQPRSGTFADVYEMDCAAAKWAVKCFTREVPGLHQRYAEISRFLRSAGLPFVVDFHYLEQGVQIRRTWYPVLKMRWVEGLLLNDFVRENVDKPATLKALGQCWARMASRLRESGAAHGDLQHGNVILAPGSTMNSLAIKLLDYDGMFVPALATDPSGEVGHPNYQHPKRLCDGGYDAEVDRFALLVVATALQALSIRGRALWDRYDNGDNLLFKEADLREPVRSHLFAELLRSEDAMTRQLTSQLVDAVRQRPRECPLLDAPELVHGQFPPSSPRPPQPVPSWVVEVAEVERLSSVREEQSALNPNRKGTSTFGAMVARPFILVWRWQMQSPHRSLWLITLVLLGTALLMVGGIIVQVMLEKEKQNKQPGSPKEKETGLMDNN